MSFRRFIPSNRNSDAERNSLQSDRPPTYTSDVTAAPTYPAGAHGPNDRVRAWSASVRSASVPSAPDSETLLDGTESSVTDTISVAETFTEAKSPTGPRYGQRPSQYSSPTSYLRKYWQYTTGCIPRMALSPRRHPLLQMIPSWDASRPRPYRHPTPSSLSNAALRKSRTSVTIHALVYSFRCPASHQWMTPAKL
jgi:hypothetical protein